MAENKKADQELQFNLIMLGEVISVKMLSVLPPGKFFFFSIFNFQFFKCEFIFLGPNNVLFKHMDKLCQVFDKVLMLDLKDEYEMASNALESLLYNIVHMRPLQNYYTGKLVGYLNKA